MVTRLRFQIPNFTSPGVPASRFARARRGSVERAAATLRKALG